MKYSFLHLLFLFESTTVLLASCATYHQKIQTYYSYVDKGEYKKASAALDDNKFLQKERNLPLYFAEKGRIEYLSNHYKESNFYLNQVDNIAEDQRKTVNDAIKGTLVNPMLQTYQIQDFEKFMVHYYKAINYCNLNDLEGAMVEARRITLNNDLLNDVKKDNVQKYSSDAFSLILQGILYEKNNDINNAFISYRNAVNTFTSQLDNKWLGTPLPDQLKQDVIRTANWLGLTDEQLYYENLFNKQYIKDTSTGGALIVFWEHGKAPVKVEQNIVLTLVKNEGAVVTYQDDNETFAVPIPTGFNNADPVGLDGLQTFRVALPSYSIVNSNDVSANITTNQHTQTNMQQVIDINTIAKQVLKENRAKDIINAVTRLVTKKAIEIGAREGTKAIAKNNGSDDKNENSQNADEIGAVVGLAFQAYSLFSEKADTRNWQTLPSGIQYVRLPLKKGHNKIQINVAGSSAKKEIDIMGNGSIQLYSFYTN